MVSTCGVKSEYGSNVRFKTGNVGNAMHLVPGLVASVVNMANFVEKLHSHNPLVDGELDLPGKVVEMP